MSEEDLFKIELKDLLKKFDVHIWGRDSGISYDKNTDSLSIEGLLIEIKDR
ncbi:hypothetical protein [Vagococcus fluvialis]|uniref:hypothetical protein n=1 Tax=Vagococcus fluvialis TaxID=2738 RepID=UPI003B2244E7